MPTGFTQNHENYVISLWEISESEEELRSFVTEGDILSCERFSSKKRRLEHLAWRAALREIIPAGDILYSKAGAPYLASDIESETETMPEGGSNGRQVNISAAHTTGLAAVIISRAPCAIDTELLNRDFGATAARFISVDEQRLCGSERSEFPTLIWCAKEALYKYSGLKELDLIRDLSILSVDYINGKMTGRILEDSNIELSFFIFKEHMIVFIAQ